MKFSWYLTLSSCSPHHALVAYFYNEQDNFLVSSQIHSRGYKQNTALQSFQSETQVPGYSQALSLGSGQSTENNPVSIEML